LIYKVEYSEGALSFLEKLGKKNPKDARRIYEWIDNNLNNCEEPRRTGKALTGQFKGSWRYRLGNFRILSEIRDDVLVIFVIEIGSRKRVYD